MLNADKPYKLSIVQVLFAFLSNGMVATSVTVTTIIRYQPASQASLISNLAHNDPGKLVITPSMQLSRGEPIYESFSDVGEIRVWWRADFQSGSRVLKKVF